jgi:hypothetical protein
MTGIYSHEQARGFVGVIMDIFYSKLKIIKTKMIYLFIF